jgi:glycosyltransferase involved in cell wall biosynthesis
MKKSLAITFVLPFVNLTGGIKILFEHANRLVERGHKVTIIYPGKLFHGENYETSTTSWKWHVIDAPLRQLKYWLFVDLLHKTDASWFPLNKSIKLHRTPDLSAKYIPEADIVIAGAETVDWVVNYPESKGVKLNFAQDYEVWARPEEYVNKTFANDMHIITIGSWQKKLYAEKFGRKVEAVIPDGVDLDRFKPKAVKHSSDTVRVLMSYHHLAYKGIPDGLYAIEQARKAGHKIDIVVFGVHPLEKELEGKVEYHNNVPEDELPDVYRSCDIFLWPTHREGFGLPPMEAMACGIPVVGTDAGAMPDYMQDGKTGYMVPIQKPKLLAEKLLKLVADKKLREQMGRNAAEAMKAWSWDEQTEKLEQYLLGIAK